MRAAITVFCALLALAAAPGAVYSAAPDPAGYELFPFQEGEPGELERGLLDALLQSNPRMQQAFETDAAKAKADPKEKETFILRWRHQTALMALRYQAALGRPIPSPNADRIQDMVSPDEYALTLYVGLRKSPEKQAEIRKQISDGNDALAHDIIAGATLGIPPDQVRGYVLKLVQAARQKAAQGVETYLALPPVQQAQAYKPPTVVAQLPPERDRPAVVIDNQPRVEPAGPVVVGSELERLRRMAAAECQGKPAEEIARCIEEYIAGASRNPNDPDPVDTRRQGPPDRPILAGPQPADGDLQLVPPASDQFNPPSHSTTGLLFDKSKGWLGPAIGVLGGALLGAFLLAPLLGVGMLIGAVIGAVAGGILGYFGGKLLGGG